MLMIPILIIITTNNNNYNNNNNCILYILKARDNAKRASKWLLVNIQGTILDDSIKIFLRNFEFILLIMYKLIFGI